jgi:hypothetical protein
VAAVLGGSTVAGIALLGCRDAAVPGSQLGPVELEPRAGQYVVAEFGFQNACADPPFALSDHAATTRSATFDLRPDDDQHGTIELTGALRVASLTPEGGDIVIFEGPDTGRYGISGDTLRLLFPKEVNQWVGVLRFSRYQAGQLAGSSRTRCRSLALRLEKLP